MEAWLREIFDWLPSGWVYYALVGGISFLESLAIVGIFCPGSFLIVFAGFLAAHGKGSYALLAAVSAVGAISGDLLSYLLGARLSGWLMKLPLLRKRKELLRKSQIYFIEHGGKSVFFGRFIGFLRPFIPFVAGSSQMRPLPFVLYAVVSGILWGAAFPGLGYFFGASWRLVRLWTGRFSLLITALLILLVLNGLFWKKLVPRLIPWGSKVFLAWRLFLQKPRVLAFASRSPGLWNFLAGRFSLQHGSGLYLTVGFTVSLLFGLLFLWVSADLPFLSRIDQQLYSLLQEAAHPDVTTFMLAIASLANGPVIAMIGGLALLWLILENRDFSAVLLLVGLGGGELLVLLLRYAMGRPHPVLYIPGSQALSASQPSWHAFAALVFCGLLVYFFLDTVRNWRSRLALLLCGSFLATLVGFSRIYLGVHGLSEVLAGFAFASIWLTFLITASEVRRRYGGEFPWRAGWQPVRLPPLARWIILAAAGLGVFVWTIDYVRTYISWN